MRIQQQVIAEPREHSKLDGPKSMSASQLEYANPASVAISAMDMHRPW